VPRARFQPTVPHSFEQLYTVDALDRAASVISIAIDTGVNEIHLTSLRAEHIYQILFCYILLQTRNFVVEGVK
jgi:hypothetical protein